MISIKFKNIAILKIGGVDCWWNINGINKIDAVNLLQNADLTDKRGLSNSIINIYY